MRISSRVETATSNQVFPLTTYNKAPLKQYASQQPGGARRTGRMVASSTVHIRECFFLPTPASEGGSTPRRGSAQGRESSLPSSQQLSISLGHPTHGEMVLD